MYRGEKAAKMGKRILSLVLCATVWMTSLPMSAFAEEAPTTSGTVEFAEEPSQEKLLSDLPAGEEREEPKITGELKEKRTENTKYFLTEDRTMVATVYNDPVHYQKNGEWEEIDNRLELHSGEEGEVYRTKESNVGLSIAKNSGQEELVRISKDGYTLSWGLDRRATGNEEEKGGDAPVEPSSNAGQSEAPSAGIGEESAAGQPEGEGSVQDAGVTKQGALAQPSGAANSSGTEAAVDFEVQGAQESQQYDAHPSVFRAAPVNSEPKTQEEIHAYNMEKASVPNLRSQGVYPNVAPGIDLQYVVYSGLIKENIIVHSKEAAGRLPLPFALEHAGMEIRVEEDGSLSMYAPDAPDAPDAAIYTMNAPYMTDAAGEVSYAVKYELSAGAAEGTSTLCIVPDADWLNAEGRAYPVVIDPNTETSKKNSDMSDTYIYTSRPDDGTQSGHGSFLVGRNYAEGLCYGMIRLNTLPQLNPGDIVYKGWLSVWQYEFSAVGEQSFKMEARGIAEEWRDGVTWNRQPQVYPPVLDYETIDGAGSYPNVQERAVDITRLARSWYNTGKNNGVMLQPMDESRYAVARFYTSNYVFSNGSPLSSAQYPSGYFFYTNTAGLENYWSFHTQDLGRAGTGNVNDFNGNLVYLHGDAATSGGRMPVALSHVYNLSEHQKSGRMGNGWRLNVMQEIRGTGTASDPYTYIDGDGTRHYFYNADGTWKDEDGLGLTLSKISEGELVYKITLKDKSEMKFDQWGYLRRVIDTSGNTVRYNYGPNAQGNFLSSITDGAGHGLELYYTTGQTRLDYITDQAGRKTSYQYSAEGDLTGIKYPDGTQTTLVYSGHQLTSVTAPGGYRVEYGYLTDLKVPRVAKITEKGGSTAGRTTALSYPDINTTVAESCGLDGDLSTKGDNLVTTYNFDQYGRPHDLYDGEGNANSYEYYTAGRTVSTGDDVNNNKVRSAGSLEKSVDNVLGNQDFSSNLNGWSVYTDSGSTCGLTRATDMGYTDRTSLKLTRGRITGKSGAEYTITGLAPGTYTLSAYVKAIGISGTGARNGAAVGTKTLRSDGMSPSRKNGQEKA